MRQWRHCCVCIGCFRTGLSFNAIGSRGLVDRNWKWLAHISLWCHMLLCVPTSLSDPQVEKSCGFQAVLQISARFFCCGSVLPFTIAQHYCQTSKGKAWWILFGQPMNMFVCPPVFCWMHCFKKVSLAGTLQGCHVGFHVTWDFVLVRPGQALKSDVRLGGAQCPKQTFPPTQTHAFACFFSAEAHDFIPKKKTKQKKLRSPR